MATPFLWHVSTMWIMSAVLRELWSFLVYGSWREWRIPLIDFGQDFNNREIIRHDQVYPTGVA